MEMALGTGCSFLHDSVGDSLTMTPRPQRSPIGYEVQPQVLCVFLASLVVTPFVW